MDHSLVEVLISGSAATIVTSVCLTIRSVCKQRRIRKVALEDLALRRHIFDQARRADVLKDLPDLRRAEQVNVQWRGVKIGGRGAREALPAPVRDELQEL
ncbi:hypothetical protein [Geodermatophilus sp. URMC 63]